MGLDGLQLAVVLAVDDALDHELRSLRQRAEALLQLEAALVPLLEDSGGLALPHAHRESQAHLGQQVRAVEGLVGGRSPWEERARRPGFVEDRDQLAFVAHRVLRDGDLDVLPGQLPERQEQLALGVGPLLDQHLAAGLDGDLHLRERAFGVAQEEHHVVLRAQRRLLRGGGRVVAVLLEPDVGHQA